MDDPRKNTWDVVLKCIAFVGIAVSGVWTYVTYWDDHKEEVRKEDDTRSRELNAYVFQKQTDLYFEAARTAAIIATSDNHAAVDGARSRLEQLYWGDLVVVEDRRIELAMITFEACMNHNDGDRCLRHGGAGEIRTDIKLADPNLRNFSLELAACIREGLKDDRGIKFGNLKSTSTTCPYVKDEPSVSATQSASRPGVS